MVPQQNMDGSRSETPTNSGLPLFGSQLVDKNSSTPYSDATQVGRWFCEYSDFCVALFVQEIAYNVFLKSRTNIITFYQTQKNKWECTPT